MQTSFSAFPSPPSAAALHSLLAHKLLRISGLLGLTLSLNSPNSYLSHCRLLQQQGWRPSPKCLFILLLHLQWRLVLPELRSRSSSHRYTHRNLLVTRGRASKATAAAGIVALSCWANQLIQPLEECPPAGPLPSRDLRLLKLVLLLHGVDPILTLNISFWGFAIIFTASNNVCNIFPVLLFQIPPTQLQVKVFVFCGGGAAATVTVILPLDRGEAGDPVPSEACDCTSSSSSIIKAVSISAGGFSLLAGN
nr:hypothetical protein Iba_chr03bCG11550 [Ipomoea batatas]